MSLGYSALTYVVTHNTLGECPCFQDMSTIDKFKNILFGPYY